MSYDTTDVLDLETREAIDIDRRVDDLGVASIAAGDGCGNVTRVRKESVDARGRAPVPRAKPRKGALDERAAP